MHNDADTGEPDVLVGEPVEWPAAQVVGFELFVRTGATSRPSMAVYGGSVGRDAAE